MAKNAARPVTAVSRTKALFSFAPAATFADHIRPVSSEDAEGLRGMFSRLSRESIYLRFHTPYPRVPEWAVASFADAERRDGVFLVAVVGSKVVGHAMYVGSEPGGEAEISVVVEDGWQSKGIGSLLLAELAVRAKRQGIEVFTAEVLGENRRVIGLLGALFGKVESRIDGGSFRAGASLRSLKGGFAATDFVEGGPSEPEANS